MNKSSAFLLAVFMLFSVPAWSCTLTNVDLPATVKKELELKCLQAQETAKAAKAAAVDKADVVVDTERLSIYAGVATEVAKAIGLAAKELGVAVNEFIKTPAGLLLIGVIILKVFGKLLTLVLIALIINLVIYRIIKTLWKKPTGESVEVSRFFGWKKRVEPQYTLATFSEIDGGVCYITFFLLVIGLVSLILIPVLGM